MDDINKQMQQLRREQARERASRAEALAVEAPSVETPPAQRAGTGTLSMQKRQGEWRYYLGDDRIRVGDELDFYVNETIGWVRGTFQWGRRNTNPPTLRVAVTHPENPSLVLGEMVVSLPEAAVCRWP